jgi:hypothetical protein
VPTSDARAWPAENLADVGPRLDVELTLLCLADQLAVAPQLELRDAAAAVRLGR